MSDVKRGVCKSRGGGGSSSRARRAKMASRDRCRSLQPRARRRYRRTPWVQPSTTFSGGMLHALTRGIHADCLPEFHEMSGPRQLVYPTTRSTSPLAVSPRVPTASVPRATRPSPRDLARSARLILPLKVFSLRSSLHLIRRHCDSSLSPFRARARAISSPFPNPKIPEFHSAERHLVAFMATRIANRVITLPFPLFLRIIRLLERLLVFQRYYGQHENVANNINGYIRYFFLCELRALRFDRSQL